MSSVPAVLGLSALTAWPTQRRHVGIHAVAGLATTADHQSLLPPKLTVERAHEAARTAHMHFTRMRPANPS